MVNKTLSEIRGKRIVEHQDKSNQIVECYLTKSW
jgi:hypothetical protein